MNIGFTYGFNAYPPHGGASAHVFQIVQRFTKRHHTVHAIGDLEMPSIVHHDSAETGIATFLQSIDLLYVRIDGSYLFRSPIKRKCMDRATVPIVWEINAPGDETLARHKLKLTREPRTGIGDIRTRFTSSMEYVSRVCLLRWEEEIRKKYARKVGAAVCISNEIEAYARTSLGIPRTYVVPNGSDPDLFTPGRDPVDLNREHEDSFKILYAGSPHWPWQSFELLQKVVESVRRITRKIVFILVVATVNERVPRGDNVVVFQGVDYFDAARYIVSADLCLCLYDCSWSRRGFYFSPTKLFDYMACAKPVIASRAGQIKAVIDDGRDGLLTYNHPDDVVQKILFALERRNELQQMGKLAREKVVRHYNWERAADATLAIFGRPRPE